MRCVRFFHRETGLIHPQRVIVSSDHALALNTPPDHDVIDDPKDKPIDPLCQRVNIHTRLVQEYQPPAPSAAHVWNPQTKRWVLSAATQARASAKAAALARIAELESSQHRAVREAVLGMDGAHKRLQALDDEIRTHRLTLNGA